MKKSTVITAAAVLAVSLTACGRGGAENQTVTAAPNSTAPVTITESPDADTTHTTNSSEPVPSPVTTGKKQGGRSLYGSNTGTSATYTGLEPLPEIHLAAQGGSGFSTASASHSFGVSKNGVPNEIAVNNQKIYEKFGGYCLLEDGKKSIYLTFDCGYENGLTPAILDTLKEKGVPAAFFVTMPYITSAPELVARMINEGHIVGNHSDHHPDFAQIQREKMAAEIESVDNALRTQFGYSSPYFRFPAGSYNESALQLVQSIGYTSVFWSSAYADWDPNEQKGADYAFTTVTSRLHPGCVLLLHAVSSDNTAALGDIIDFARAQGYEFRALP